MMEFLLTDLRHALRKLKGSPLFTAVAIFTLAVGIGANTAVFSVVHGVLLKPLSAPEPDRLVSISYAAPGLGEEQIPQAPSLYLTTRDESEAFVESGMWRYGQVSITGREEPEEVKVIVVTEGVLPILGLHPLHGRAFTAEDDSPGTAETVILSDEYWHRRLGGDPAAIGQTIMIDGRPREIIGVLAPATRFLDEDPALYLPFRLDRQELHFGNFSYEGIARLAPGVSLEAAGSEVARMIPIAIESFPMPAGLSRAMIEGAGLTPRIEPLKESVIGDVDKVLWVLLGTVGLVLLVAGSNVANLFLVRAEARRQELATRAALGASRGQVIRELLLESVLLSLAGGAAGLGLAWIGLGVLESFAPRGLPRLAEISIDSTVLLFTFFLSAMVALLFGLLPALRQGTDKLFEALKEGGRGASVSKHRLRTRNLLVVSQVAMALVLLIGSGLMIRTYRALENVDPGFVGAENVLTLRLAIPEALVEDGVEAAGMHAVILEKLSGLPGVTSAGMTTAIPLSNSRSFDPIFVEDFPGADDQIPPLRRFIWTEPGYFETLGIPLVAGRPISWADIHDQAHTVVVSANFARIYWENPAAALGRRIRAFPQSPWREIVGVVGDVHADGLNQDAPPTIYWPMVQKDFYADGEVETHRSMAYLIRSPRVGAEGFLEEVQQAIWSVSSSLPLANVRTLEEYLRRSKARTSFTLVMLAIAAVAALLLGAVGIYGVTSYTVSQRTGEIGVRMALGARRRDVSSLVLRHAALLAALGVGIGLAAAAGLTRLMSALLYGVSALDPVTYGTVGALVAVIALIASYVPARRAAAVNPIEVLRQR